MSQITYFFRALHSRNYRLFFWGQSFSLVGTWMQQVALQWLVYRLTESSFILGALAFTAQFPNLIITPWVGVWVDRLDRKKMFLAIQWLGMAQASLLALLVGFEIYSIPMLFSLAVFWGVVSALDAPTRQSFVVQLVDRKEDFGSVIALNSALFNGARMIGPPIAGILIASSNEFICFFINAVSYFPVLFFLRDVQSRPTMVRERPQAAYHELKLGFDYVRHHREIRLLLIHVALVSFFSMPYLVLMPVFAKEVLAGDAHTLGLLMGAIGLGALFGAFYLGNHNQIRHLWQTTFYSGFVFSLGLLVFALSHALWLSLGAIFFAGTGMMLQLATSNTLLHTLTDEDKRGRVMSFYATAMMGVLPFGSFFTGWIADLFSAPSALLFNVVCGCGAMILFGIEYRKLNINT